MRLQARKPGPMLSPISLIRMHLMKALVKLMAETRRKVISLTRQERLREEIPKTETPGQLTAKQSQILRKTKTLVKSRVTITPEIIRKLQKTKKPSKIQKMKMDL